MKDLDLTSSLAIIHFHRRSFAREAESGRLVSHPEMTERSLGLPWAF